MSLKRFALYGGLFLTGVSIGSWTTALSSNYVRMSAYQRTTEQLIKQAMEDCNAYSQQYREYPEVFRPPITIRSEGATTLVFPDVYCPVRMEQLEQDLKTYKKAKFNPFNIWR